MKAIVLHENKEFKIMNYELPKIKDDEVLIKVAFCGVCGSDLARFYDGAKYYPIVLGHEFSGCIVDVGKDVKLHKGTKVGSAPLKPCFECDNCLAGNYFACSNYQFMGSGCGGAFQEYVAVNYQNIVILDEEIDLMQAAFIEPLTVALHAINRVKIHPLDEIVVLGCGTIGLMIIQALKARGINNITVVDVANAKLQTALKYGVAHITDKLDKTNAYDIIFECTGVNFLQSEVINYMNPHGRICYVGTAHNDVVISPVIFEQILRKELIITGSWMSYSFPFPGEEWLYAQKLIASNQIQVKDLITLVDMHELAQGFALMKAFDADKVMVQMDKQDE